MEKLRPADERRTWKEWHGWQGEDSWDVPALTHQSDVAGRADQGNYITANEYLDTDEVLDKKVDKVVELLRKAKCCTAYTGAGLSKASGIPDYATKSDENEPSSKLVSNLDAQPTYAHCVITALERANLIHHYVQQNHDGLPQKSGFPQEKMNEIHGAWFDPSNPVVQFGGNLRGDLFDWMLEMQDKTDLTIACGTSLSGMNADRMASKIAKRAIQCDGTTTLGTVLINLQRTHLDGKCSIRIWAKLDDVFRLIAQKLGLENQVIVKKPISTVINSKEEYWVPYDRNGKRDPTQLMKFDLSHKAKVRICVEGAMNENVEGYVHKKRGPHYSLALNEKNNITGPTLRLFGDWWVEGAVRGLFDQLPVVNVDSVLEYKQLKPPPPTIQLTQTHSSVPDPSGGRNSHQWSIFFPRQSDKDAISHVVYRLHKTFSPIL
eukprot:TRINITY_DN2017_c0_g2_i2.p1 TRINITY_DN2017_c0_g2~~TRINITY_DN2017_c0_g2_i2.p1  ORF type:complete len:434 (-),score=74.20 TRINITY_DN2017_c0_g2_i2:117-1418(-)